MGEDIQGGYMRGWGRGYGIEGIWGRIWGEEDIYREGPEDV